jgi:hypothetical protein
MATDIATCLSTGKCVAISNTSYYISIGFFILAGLFLLILVFLKMWTPAFTFLKAKMKRSSIIYTVNRAQQGTFVLANDKQEGLLDTKKGPYIMTEGSHTIDKGSKLPLFFAFGEFAATLDLNYPYIVQTLRSQGVKMDNWDDIDGLINGWREKLTDKRIKEVEKTDRQKALRMLDQREQLKKFSLRIRPFKTIPLHQLGHMFPYNVTPSKIEDKIVHAVALQRAKMSKFMNKESVIFFLMILIGGVIAAVIAYKFLGGGGGGETVIIRESVKEGAKVVVNNATSGAPLIG